MSAINEFGMMTKEEILAMKPGEELDELVAKEVMGYSKEIYGESWEWVLIDETGEVINWQPSRWSPSTDISAAWEVVEKLKETYGVEIYVEQEIVICRLFGEITEAPTELEIISNTVPEAICKAALLAKLKEE